MSQGKGEGSWNWLGQEDFHPYQDLGRSHRRTLGFHYYPKSREDVGELKWHVKNGVMNALILDFGQEVHIGKLGWTTNLQKEQDLQV